MTLLKVSAAKPGNELAASEKIKAMEEKKRGEEMELQNDIANKKAEKLFEIKTKFNQRAKDITLDVELLKQALASVSL